MALKFNVFTGNFDQTGSGGGGASYIDGEVATYADLPLDGTAALNSAWLVRSSSGIWPFNKPAGIYYRSATLGVSRDADYTYGGTLGDVFSDSVFLVYDEASTTRTGQFNLGSVTAGQNRVLTWPDGNGTIALNETFAAPPAIGNTTPAAGTFTTLSANNGTLTASAPVLDLSQTWNASGTTFTAFRVNATETAAGAGSLLMALQNNGTSQFIVRRDGVCAGSLFALGTNTLGNSLLSTGVRVTSGSRFSWSDNSTSIYATEDLQLHRDAADTLAQRRGANGQTYRLYNTYTDASNHERLSLRWASNVAIIGTEKAGTGSARTLEFQTDGVTRLSFTSGGNTLLAATFSLVFAERGRIIPVGDGVWRFSDVGDGNFGRIQFGGTTTSFPALKRSSAILQARLADDSGYTVMDAQLRAQGAAPATSGAAGTAGDIRYDADYIYVCTAASTWKRAAIATW